MKPYGKRCAFVVGGMRRVPPTCRVTMLRLLEGKIDNEPGVVKNVKLGQAWKIKKEEISDWSFKRNEKIHGNYTMRPLLKTLPKEDADYYRSLLANP